MMTNIRFVRKKIGNSYLVWFKESNLYYQLKEPAWFVFEKLLLDISNETIADEFSEHYTLSFEESLNFVNDVQTKINELNQPNKETENTHRELPDLSNYEYETYVSHIYLIGTELIRFSFESNWLEYYIHPLIEHLKIGNKELTQIHFELFTYNSRVIFRFNGKPMGDWPENESHLVKGRVFMTLLNVIYKKTDFDWLMTVHASALTNGKKTILFSAPPNSGKTTIAALLHTQGYQLISDDFVAIDKQFKAYPFPSAISVKEESLNLLKPFFPSLEQKKLNYINETKNVKYLPLENTTTMIFSVKEFVFIKYDKNVEFKWERMNPLEAIKLLLEQTWVAPTFNNAEILFGKVEESSFFQLNYSNNEKALQVLKQLFSYE